MFCQVPPSLSCQQYACALTPVNMCRCCSGACMPPFGHLSPSPRPYFAQAAPHRRPPSQAAPGQAQGASGGQPWPRLGRTCPLPAAVLVQAPRQPPGAMARRCVRPYPSPPHRLMLVCRFISATKVLHPARRLVWGRLNRPRPRCPPPHLVLNLPPPQQPSRSDGRRQQLRRPPAGAPAHPPTLTGRRRPLWHACRSRGSAMARPSSVSPLRGVCM